MTKETSSRSPPTTAYDETGSWQGGIGIHLEPASNAFPKTEFTIQLELRLWERTCELRIPPDGSFTIDISDPSGWKPAIEHIIRALVTTLELQPWEPSSRKGKIGFVWQDTE